MRFPSFRYRSIARTRSSYEYMDYLQERIHLPADDDCPDCGGQLKPLGEDVAEQLEYVRAHFRVIRHRRPKLACACCDRIVQAAAPSRPIDRGIPGPALLAHIAVSKFAYHIPLHRQAVMYARDGVEIDPGAMGYAICCCSNTGSCCTCLDVGSGANAAMDRGWRSRTGWAATSG